MHIFKKNKKTHVNDSLVYTQKFIVLMCVFIIIFFAIYAYNLTLFLKNV